MKNQFSAYYRPKREEFLQKFKEGVFVFDTNVLLNLYRYTPESRDSVIAIFRTLQGRLWLPHQVGLEYHQHRIKELINQHSLVEKVVAEIEKAQASIKNLGRSSMLFAVNAIIEPVQKQLKEVTNQLEKKKEKRPDLMDGDAILHALTDLFDSAVGQPYTKEEYEQIYKEGKERYEKQIPPGYKDKGKPEADQFGDLVIWKQLIRHGKAEARPLIFVTDDLKDDWWHEIAGEKLGPRVELREEFHGETGGKWFYIYSMEQFLKHAQNYLSVEVPQALIKETEGIDADRRKANQGTISEEPESTIYDPRYRSVSDAGA